MNKITLLQYFCAILLLSHSLQCLGKIDFTGNTRKHWSNHNIIKVCVFLPWEFHLIVILHEKHKLHPSVTQS